MDLYVLICVLSVMHSWIVYTALCAPLEQKPSAAPQRRHVRTKRCSCATFLDNECVYFCHLDIIWVNTPERVVSYGLGNAPRTKRAAVDSRTRCQCLNQNDYKCQKFCRLDNHLRHEPSADSVMEPSADSVMEQAADTDTISRMRVRAAMKTRLLLNKWRARTRHRARVWAGESTAS